MRFPTIEEMAKEIAERAMNEYEYEGKTILQWVEVLKDYDDKKSTLERILTRLEEKKQEYLEGFRVHQENELYGIACGFGDSIKICKKEGGIE